jgi:hypothetical protein
MDLDRKIDALARLGKIISLYNGGGVATDRDPDARYFRLMAEALQRSRELNGWFTPENLHYALGSWASLLDGGKLRAWIEPYRDRIKRQKMSRSVGVVIAGNIPLVGFHDLLCVLLTDHRFEGKLSSQDPYLLPCLSGILEEIEPGFAQQVSYTTGSLSKPEALIATGNDATAAHLEYYFRDFPSLIRRNRNGIAVLTGAETETDLAALADDVFLYFGLGCRSVSKLYIPEDFDLGRLKESFRSYSSCFLHNKYRNNYDYHKSIFLVNREPFLDMGFLLVKEDTRLASPVSVLYVEKYPSKEALLGKLMELEKKVQCIVSVEEMPYRGCLPGQSQHPGLADYADGTDTLDFLLGLGDKN